MTARSVLNLATSSGVSQASSAREHCTIERGSPPVATSASAIRVSPLNLDSAGRSAQSDIVISRVRSTSPEVARPLHWALIPSLTSCH